MYVSFTLLVGNRSIVDIEQLSELPPRVKQILCSHWLATGRLSTVILFCRTMEANLVFGAEFAAFHCALLITNPIAILEAC